MLPTFPYSGNIHLISLNAASDGGRFSFLAGADKERLLRTVNKHEKEVDGYCSLFLSFYIIIYAPRYILALFVN